MFAHYYPLFSYPLQPCRINFLLHLFLLIQQDKRETSESTFSCKLQHKRHRHYAKSIMYNMYLHPQEIAIYYKWFKQVSIQCFLCHFLSCIITVSRLMSNAKQVFTISSILLHNIQPALCMLQNACDVVLHI